MYYNDLVFRIDNNWFNYCPYSNLTGGCGYVQNSGLKSTDCLVAVSSTSGFRVQNQFKG